MEERKRRHPIETSSVARNINIVILLSLTLAGIVIYYWVRPFAILEVSLADLLQYSLLREFALDVCMLAGVYLLYLRKTAAWAILTATYALAVIITLRLLVMAGPSTVGFGVLGGAGDSLRTQSLLAAILFGLSAAIVPLRSILRRDTREASRIVKHALRATLRAAIAFPALVTASYFVTENQY